MDSTADLWINRFGFLLLDNFNNKNDDLTVVSYCNTHLLDNLQSDIFFKCSDYEKTQKNSIIQLLLPVQTRNTDNMFEELFDSDLLDFIHS